jgi:hypothetical protein
MIMYHSLIRKFPKPCVKCKDLLPSRRIKFHFLLLLTSKFRDTAKSFQHSKFLRNIKKKTNVSPHSSSLSCCKVPLMIIWCVFYSLFFPPPTLTSPIDYCYDFDKLFGEYPRGYCIPYSPEKRVYQLGCIFLFWAWCQKMANVNTTKHPSCIVVMISACHAEGPGSIPGEGDLFF